MLEYTKATLTIEYVSIADLRPASRNARTHSAAQIQQIARSIEQFGWTNPILIDVLATQHGQTLPNALYMPAGGMPGTFDDNYQTQFAQQLSQATGGDMSRPVVFFCQGASCWESYNAVLRANAGGHTNIYWYRGGLFAWQEAGYAMSALPATYGEAAQTGY